MFNTNIEQYIHEYESESRLISLLRSGELRWLPPEREGDFIRRYRSSNSLSSCIQMGTTKDNKVFLSADGCLGKLLQDCPTTIILYPSNLMGFLINIGSQVHKIIVSVLDESYRAIKNALEATIEESQETIELEYEEGESFPELDFYLRDRSFKKDFKLSAASKKMKTVISEEEQLA